MLDTKYSDPDLEYEVSLMTKLQIGHIKIAQPSILEPPVLECTKCGQTIGTVEEDDLLEGLIYTARVHGGITCPGALEGAAAPL